MKNYRVEFGFGENFVSIDEFQTMDELNIVKANNAEEAAKYATCIDGLENALFRVYELTDNGYGTLEPIGDAERFFFH